MQIDDPVVAELYEHIGSSYPNECCGFIRNTTYGPAVIPVKNEHSMPRVGFKISPLDYMAYGGDAICMYHSHPHGEARASEGDIEVYEVTNLPQLVINWPYGQMSMYGVASAPLLGRPFVYGIFDCYALVRTYYMEQYGVELTDYVRPRFGWWELGAEDPFNHYYGHAGFRRVEKDVQPGDLVLLRLAGSVKANHVGVITDNSKMLHHRLNSFSCEVSYDGYYRDNTTAVLRYGD